MTKIIVALIYWLSTFCEGASAIIIPLYFNSKGISAADIGLMFFFFEIFGLITNFLSGFYINRVGYKLATCNALICHILASFGYLILDSSFSTVLVVSLVFVFRSFRGIGTELLKLTSSAYFKSELNKETKYKFLPQHSLQGIKDIIRGFGLLLGGLILSYYGFDDSFIFLGIITIFCLILAIKYLPKRFDKVSVSNPKDFFKVRKNMRKLAWKRSFLYFAREIWISVPLPLLLASKGVSKKDISLLLAAAFIIYGFSQPLLGVFIKLKIAVRSFSLKSPWRHKDLLIFPNLVLIPLPILIYQSLGDVNVLYPLILLYAFFAGLCVTPHNHLHLKFANSKRSSLDISYYRTIAQIGKMIAALMSGFIFEYLGIEWNLTLSSMALVAAALLTFSIALKTEKN